MLLYHFDHAGAYLSSSEAEMSPLEQDVPLVPAYATLLEPPTATEGQRAVFIDGAWVPAAGGDPVVLAALAAETVFTTAVQSVLDAEARSMGYDNIFTAVTYDDEPAVPEFQAEGQSLRAWRSLTWRACNRIGRRVSG